MFKVHRFALVAVVLLAAMTVGCQKTVQLRINNFYENSQRAQVQAPGINWVDLGPIPAQGMIVYDLKIDKKLLPADSSCTVGKETKTFTVTEGMLSPQWIDFSPLHKPQMRDQYTTVKHKHKVEIKRIPITGPREVIE